MNSMTDCRIYDIEKHADSAQHDVLALGRQVMDIQLHEMLNLINRCRMLDLERLNVSSTTVDEEISAREMQETTQSPLSLPSNLTQILSLWRGIVPGTKWCGPGDDADGYSDIGLKFGVDTCCRSHDLCPVRLKPFRVGYGMVNFSVYTK